MSESLPPDAPDLSGTQYVLEKLLGQGGFGAAYAAFNRALRRRCVLKVLTDTNNSGFVARFFREAQVLASLDHAAIPRVFEAATTKTGQPFIAMELIDGKSLGDHLADEGGTLPLHEACRLIADAAEGLAAAHEMGVVHRDVKLANLLVNKRGAIKVIDFGIAKKLVEEAEQTAGILTRKGDLFGTPRYMSPEQAMAKPLGPASDFYSLGIVLFILLTGRSPFNGTAHEMMTGHVMGRRPKLSELAGQPFPATIEAVVERLLMKDASARFNDGHELAAVLRAVGGVTSLGNTASQPSWSNSANIPAVAARDARTAAPIERAPTPAPTEHAPMRFEQPSTPSPAARRTQLQLGETVRRLMVSEPSIVLTPIVAPLGTPAEASLIGTNEGATPQPFVSSTSPAAQTEKALHAVTQGEPAGVAVASAARLPRDVSQDYAATELAMPAITFTAGASLTQSASPANPIVVAHQTSAASPGQVSAPVPAIDYARKDATPSSLQTAVGIAPAAPRRHLMTGVLAAVLVLACLVTAGALVMRSRTKPSADPMASGTTTAPPQPSASNPQAPSPSAIVVVTPTQTPVPPPTVEEAAPKIAAPAKTGSTAPPKSTAVKPWVPPPNATSAADDRK